MRNSSGMAVISLDLLSTAVRAGTRRLASAQAPIRVQGLQAPAPIVGAAHALAVDGHDLAPGQGEGRLHPVPEAFLEAGRVQPREDPAQGVVRGNAVRQGQEGAQPLLVEPAEEGNGHEAVRPADDRQHGQNQDVRQGVQFGAVNTEIPGVSMVSTRDGDFGLFTG